MTSVGIAQNSDPNDQPTTPTPSARSGAGDASGTINNSAIPHDIKTKHHVVNSVRVTASRLLRAERKSDADPLNKRPSVFAHAKSLMSPCENPPLLFAASPALCKERAGYAPTICDRLLMTVIPAPRPSANEKKSR